MLWLYTCTFTSWKHMTLCGMLLVVVIAWVEHKIIISWVQLSGGSCLIVWNACWLLWRSPLQRWCTLSIHLMYLSRTHTVKSDLLTGKCSSYSQTKVLSPLYAIKSEWGYLYCWFRNTMSLSLSLIFPATSYSALTTVSVEDFQDSDFSDIEVTRITW